MRPLLLLTPLLLLPLSGCFGSSDVPRGCFPPEVVKLSDIPFANNLSAFDQNGRTVWVVLLSAKNACVDQHATVSASARIAAPSTGCPAGDARMTLKASAGPTSGTPTPLQAGYEDGDAIFSGSTSVGLRQFEQPVSIYANLQVDLPKAENAEKDRECAMDRIKELMVEIHYMQAEATSA